MLLAQDLYYLLSIPFNPKSEDLRNQWS